MIDQNELWNHHHGTGKHAKFAPEPVAFAKQVVNDIKPGSKILELGCGIGNDARFFADSRLRVTATDFSNVVIDQNKSTNSNPNLAFEVLNITNTFPYHAESFDAVYAHLSLHYFDDIMTGQIFAEISRVLKQNGTLYFSCKSTKDPKYGHGDLIGPDTFDNNGHIRHFFTTDFARQVAEAHFTIISLTETEADYVGEHSAFVECWAQKK